MHCPDCDIEFSGVFCPNCGKEVEPSVQMKANHGKPNLGQMADLLAQASKSRSANSVRPGGDGSSAGRSRFGHAAKVGFASASASQPIKKASRAKGRTELLILVVVLVAAISVEAVIFDVQASDPAKSTGDSSWTMPGWVQDVYEWFTSDDEASLKHDSRGEVRSSSEVDGITLYHPDESNLSSSLRDVDDKERVAKKRKSIKQQIVDTEAWSNEQAEDVQKVLLKVGLDDFELVSGPNSAQFEYPYLVAWCYGHDVWVDMTKHGVDLVTIYMVNDDPDPTVLYSANAEDGEDDEDDCYEMKFDPKKNACVPLE